MPPRSDIFPQGLRKSADANACPLTNPGAGGTIIDRYGSNGSGRYFSPDGTPYAERALPPFMERQPYNRYRVVQPFDVKAGEIAPWFNQPGKGIQFLSDYSLKYLLKHGYIEILK